MDNDLETARCSGCKRNNLPISNFPWRRPGVRYKTCNRCRTPSHARDRDQVDQEATAGNQIAQRRDKQNQETIAAGQTTQQIDQGVEEQEEVDQETARCLSCRRDNLPMLNFDMNPSHPGVRYKKCNRCRPRSNVQLGGQEDVRETARCSSCKRNDLPMSNFTWRRPGVRYKTCNQCRYGRDEIGADGLVSLFQEKAAPPCCGNQCWSTC